MEWAVLYIITVIGLGEAMHQQELVIADMQYDVDALYENQEIMEDLSLRLAGSQASTYANQNMINRSTEVQIKAILQELHDQEEDY